MYPLDDRYMSRDAGLLVDGMLSEPIVSVCDQDFEREGRTTPADEPDGEPMKRYCTIRVSYEQKRRFDRTYVDRAGQIPEHLHPSDNQSGRHPDQA